MAAPIAIVLVGKTHSGKTSLANRIQQHFPSFTIIESDPIGIFVKDQFGELCSDNEHTGDFKNPSLKFKIYETILEFAINRQKNVILANSNLFSKIRNKNISLLRQAGYQVIMIYLNLPNTVLEQRIKSTTRPTDVLRYSKSFAEVLQRQHDVFDVPIAVEADAFIEIKNEAGLENLAQELTPLITQQLF